MRNVTDNNSALRGLAKETESMSVLCRPQGSASVETFRIEPLSVNPAPTPFLDENPLKIVIRNYLAASFLLEQEPQIWDAIVILDSGLMATDFVATNARRHIYLRFDDVVAATTSKRPPTISDIRKAMGFATISENLLVSCRAGQSRSVAIAFLIAFQQMGSAAALSLLNPKRHSPNSLIVRLGEQLVDDPLMWSMFNGWRERHQGIRLSDYVDDIEREFDELELLGAKNRIIHTRYRPES